MTDYKPDTTPVCEGDDFPEPIRANTPYLFAWKTPAGVERGHHRVDYAVSPRPSGPTRRLFRDWILPRPNSQIFFGTPTPNTPQEPIGSPLSLALPAPLAKVLYLVAALDPAG
jgi:hypothetical protein